MTFVNALYQKTKEKEAIFRYNNDRMTQKMCQNVIKQTKKKEMNKRYVICDIKTMTL